jgi:tetratricopeptide (TPR) repeat protein
MGEPGREALARADEAWQAGDFDGAIVELSAAVRSFMAGGDNRAAALAAARLGDLFSNGLGNRVAARPWFLRAIRLVADEEPCVEQGWAAVAMLGCEVDDPELLNERAALALERARQFGDLDLEIKALADAGLAQVQLGQLEAGMEMADEAMALACGGGATDSGVVAKSVCSFFTACSYAADFARFASWTAAFRQRGLVDSAPTPGPALFLTGHCDSVQATLLCHLGQWTEAEELLARTHQLILEVMPRAAYHTPIALAELRLLQGRLDEAESLLLGRDDNIAALLPTARLWLERGELELAASAARRGLRLMPTDRLRAPKLLAILAEARIGLGEVDAAESVAAELEVCVANLRLPAAAAEAARVRSLVLTARGDQAAAVDALQAGLDVLAGADMPYQRMLLHLELARLLEPTDRAAASAEVRAATALLARLDVVLSADAALLVDRLCPLPSRPGADGVPSTAMLAWDGDGWWTAGCGATKVRLKDTKGLRYLAELVARPHTERHVLDLLDAVEGSEPGRVDRRALGDAGVVSDGEARRAYRARVEALRTAVDEALDVEDDDRAARLQAELDDLVAELARAFGLGGRERRASSATEKARLNVTRALRAALVKLMEGLPEGGAILDRRIRTGTYCAYEPQAGDTVRWHVQRALNGPRRA